MNGQVEHVWHLGRCLLCGQHFPGGGVRDFAQALNTIPFYHCSERAAIRRKFAVLARRRAQ